jgi:DNA-binding response OmpR family regulator
MQILIAEDNAPVAKILSGGLQAEHYDVRVTSRGGQVMPMIDDGQCNLLILDFKMPGVGGLELLRQVRAAKPHLPIMIVTGSSRVEDRVDGLDSGADDYLTKPFAFAEFLARVRALLRRNVLPFELVLQNSDLVLDRVRHAVHRKGHAIELTPKEFALLEYLMLNAGKTVARSSIIHHVWKLSFAATTNVIDVYINYLRKKIDAAASEKLIHTVRGAGYRFGSKCNASVEANGQSARAFISN